MSFPIRVNALLIADQRFIFLALRNSNALPMVVSNYICLTKIKMLERKTSINRSKTSK